MSALMTTTGRGPSRRFRAVGVGVAALALTLTACGGTDDQNGGDGGEAITDAEVTFASTAITNTLDPHAVQSSSGRSFAKHVFDTLVRFDADGQIEPGLATEWERIDDTTMSFTLREGVEFHSGTPFEAEAVKQNVERVLSGDAAYAVVAGRLGQVEVEVVSPTEVRLKTENPDPILLNRLTLFDIVDPGTFDDAATEVSGTGPFKMVEHKAADHITLERVEGSWRESESVKTVVLQQIPDPSTIVSAMKTDAVDIGFALPPDLAVEMEGQGFTTTKKSAGSSAINSLIADAEPKLEDVRVREAINLAINREEFVDAALGGFGVPNGSQLLQEGYLGYDPEIEHFEYDPERAEELIAEAGAEGLELPIATTALFKTQAEAVAGYLNAVGFKSEVVIQDLSAFIGSLLQKSEYPLLYWQTDYFDLRDISSVVRLGPQPDGVQPHIPVGEYQELFVEQASQMDEAEREATIQEMARVLKDDAGVLFLAWPENVYTSHERVGELPLGGDSLVRFEELTVTE